MNPKAVIFDWAGTTVDHGSRAPIAAFLQVFADDGIALSEADARLAMGRDKWTHIRDTLALPPVQKAFVDRHGRASTDADIDRLHAAFMPVQIAVIEGPGCTPIDGVVPMVQQLVQRGVRVASTTGYTRNIMDVLMPAAASLGYAPEFCMTADDAPAGRPAPWMLFRACERLGVYPVSEVIAVDDTTVGIQAARNAGMMAVGVAATGNLVGLDAEGLAALEPADRAARIARARQALYEAGAHVVIDSAAQLIAQVIDAP